MLVLTRKKAEAIKIGKDIEISIISIEGEQVKIGINAPKSIDIYRKEIYEEIQLQNSEAMKVPENVISLLQNKE